MTDEQKAASINARAAVLVATVLGMAAENAQRQLRGHSMAYDEDAFAAAINSSGATKMDVEAVFFT